MTEQEMVELAERAGFSWHEKREYVHGELMHGGSWQEGHWDYQGKCCYEMLDGQQGCFYKLPDFRNSLDADFKWLVPKVQQRGHVVELTAFEGGGYEVRILNLCQSRQIPPEDFYQPVVSIRDNNPALALCLAIEKVKGEGND